MVWGQGTDQVLIGNYDDGARDHLDNDGALLDKFVCTDDVAEVRTAPRGSRNGRRWIRLWRTH